VEAIDAPFSIWPILGLNKPTALGRTLILPPEHVDETLSQNKEAGRWIPLASVMDPIELQAIFSILDVAYLPMENLRQWDPARISVFDSGIENEHTFISFVGWEDVPRTPKTSMCPLFLTQEMYIRHLVHVQMTCWYCLICLGH
jgi:hypothetical protein